MGYEREDGPRVAGVEVIKFDVESRDIGREPVIGFPIYSPGDTMVWSHFALRIVAADGSVGEYVGGTEPEYSTFGQLTYMLIGRSALEREAFYQDSKQALRQVARLGLGVIDIALWDLAGRYVEQPIYQMLGGRPRGLPAYASTFAGDYASDGLSSPEAYADFAEACLETGYRAFKVHPRVDASVDEQMATVRAVGERVGGRMDLMLDPFCSFRTFADALKVGRVCDEFDFYWYEDPFRDGGVSAFAHKRLRERLSTPMLQLEHVRGVEAHVDQIVAGATDFVRGDPVYDGGITGVMKLAHAAEGFGLDVELHGPGPARRQLMAAIHNTNYYELGLVHPVADNFVTVGHHEFTDRLTDIDDRGEVNVPTGPGLGISYDWDWIRSREVDRRIYGKVS